MAIPVAVDDRWEMRVICRFGDQISVNTRVYRVFSDDSDPVVTDLDIALELETKFESEYKDVLVSDAEFRGLSVQRISPLPKTVPQISSVSAGAGVALGTPLPSQVTGVIALKTDFSGRSFQGRVYVPFPGSSAADVDGKPTDGYLLSLGDLGTSFVDDVSIDGITSGAAILRPTLDRTGTLTTKDITSRLVRDAFGTQRRRGTFGRTNLPPF